MRIPQSFREMPRWWGDGTGWLDALPALIRDQCARRGLTVCGEPAHGSNAIAVPVRRCDGEFVLRLTPPGPEVAEQVAALRFWDGRGTVRLVDADVDAGTMLLERLGSTSLIDVPVAEALPVLGALMRRLAVPSPPPHVPSTADVVARRLTTMEQQWAGLGRPFPPQVLAAAMDAGSRLTGAVPDRAVNADLHSRQVLRGGREPWLVVDPVLMRGDIGYDLGRVLWTRLDEIADIPAALRSVVSAAGLDRDRSRDGVLFRTVDYWLWGLDAGLTDDPERCRRLVAAVLG